MASFAGSKVTLQTLIAKPRFAHVPKIIADPAVATEKALTVYETECTQVLQNAGQGKLCAEDMKQLVSVINEAKRTGALVTQLIATIDRAG